MVNKKNVAIFGLFIIVAAMLAWIVMAVPMENTNVRAPTNGVNASGSLLILFNVTFLNGTNAGGTADVVNVTLTTLNVTFWVNITETQWYPIGNATTCVNFGGVQNSLVNNISCWGTLNASTLYGDAANLSGNGSRLADGLYRINATIWNGSDGAYGKPMISTQRGNMTNITIDNTQPSTVTPIILTSGNNHSTKSLGGNLTLNVTVVDSLTRIGSVRFNIINASGFTNGSYIGISNNETTYSFSINISHFPDGRYNISIQVNDTVGNYNVSANASGTAPLRRLIFDNTIPSVSVTCTSNAEVGAAFPCSCQNSDATAGINESSEDSTSSDALGTPTITGTFTYSCSATDRAGNTKSDSTTYTITEPGSTGGGGGSGGGGTSSAGGSGGSGGPGTTTGNGSVGAGTGGSASGQGTGTAGQGGAGAGRATGWIISIIVVIVLIVVIVFYVKKKKM